MASRPPFLTSSISSSGESSRRETEHKPVFNMSAGYLITEYMIGFTFVFLLVMNPRKAIEGRASANKD